MPWGTLITGLSFGNIVPIGEQHFFDAHEVDAAHTEFSAGFVEATRG